MVPYGSSVSLFYAMWIRHGRGRIYESKERRKYHDEEPDGFLYESSALYDESASAWYLYLSVKSKYFIANKDVKSYLFSKNLFPSPTQVRASFVIQLTNGRFTF